MQSSVSHFIRLSLGNIIQWYDFSLYIYFAHALATAFFPQLNSYQGMRATLLIFFLGFASRMLGGVLLGLWADKRELKKMIHYSVWIMATATTLVAVLPDYHHIGIAAPVLLLVLRIVQGFAIGGQFPGLMRYSYERFETNRAFALSTLPSLSRNISL